LSQASIPPYGYYVDGFQRHFRDSEGPKKYDYNYYAAAYRYGYDLAADQRYKGKTWEEVQADARSGWESAGHTPLWEDVKEIVRHAWEEVAGGQDSG